jgi:hypothetical protein
MQSQGMIVKTRCKLPAGAKGVQSLKTGTHCELPAGAGQAQGPSTATVGAVLLF